MLRIKTLRKAHGLSQTKLAGMVGVTQTCISDLENGKETPRFSILIRLAKALDCTLDELVDLESAFKAS